MRNAVKSFLLINGYAVNTKDDGKDDNIQYEVSFGDGVLNYATEFSIEEDAYMYVFMKIVGRIEYLDGFSDGIRESVE